MYNYATLELISKISISDCKYNISRQNTTLEMHEIITYSLLKNENYNKLINIYNPLTEEYSMFRNTLIVNLIKVNKYNCNQNNETLEDFEIVKTLTIKKQSPK